MSQIKPRYELARVFDDGTQERAEVLPVTAIPWETNMNRRGFLGVGMTATAVLTALGGAHTAFGAGRKDVRADNKATNMPGLDCEEARAQTDDVSALAVTPDGKILVSGSADNTVKLWGLPDGELLKTLQNHTSVYALAITPDGKTVVSGSWGAIKLWSLPDGKLLKTLRGQTGNIEALTITPDGKILVSGSDDNSIKLWGLPDGKLLETFKRYFFFKAHTSDVLALAISPNGKTLASGSRDESIKIWGLPDGKLRESLEGHTDDVSALAMSPDGKTLASGSRDETVKLWGLPDGKLRKTFETRAHADNVSALAIAPDGKTLVSGSGDHAIRLWDLPDGLLRRTLEGHTSDVLALAITPDGKTLASGGRDKTIRLWDMPNGNFKTCLADPKASPTSANGKRGGSRGGGYTICTCDKVCTCVPVYYCQAHKLLDPDVEVRVLAEELLLLMGTSGLSYFRWAAAEAEGDLQLHIHQTMSAIRGGSPPSPMRWPPISKLVRLLAHSEQIVALMAAQLLLNSRHPQASLVNRTVRSRAEAVLAAGQPLHIAVRAKVEAFVAKSDGR